MAVKNSVICEKIWLSGSNNYQQRMPQPSQHSMSATFRQLFAPGNGNLYNEFVYGFINLIGTQVVHDRRWNNPLKRFIKTSEMYGATIQESAAQWIKAHAYDDASEDLLKMHRPEFEVWYHSLNREDVYPISVVRTELMRAFRDEYGLNRLINAILNIPFNSDEFDTYTYQKQLIAEYEQNWSFFKISLDEPTDEESAKAVLKSVRAMAETLAFPSTAYNAAPVTVPTYAGVNELILFITPQAKASLDVDALSAVFQLDKADIPYTIITIDEFPIPNAYMLLTTDAFFVCQDLVYQTESFHDPSNMRDNFYLHHWQILSASPFVPAVLYTTATGTEIPTVTMTATGITATATPTTVAPGGTVEITTALTGTVAPGGETDCVQVAPDAATYAVSASRPGAGTTDPATPIQLNSRTYVDRLGVLHVQKSDLKTGDTITVTCTSTYINPSGATTPYTATATVSVV